MIRFVHLILFVLLKMSLFQLGQPSVDVHYHIRIQISVNGQFYVRKEKDDFRSCFVNTLFVFNLYLLQLFNMH